MSVLIAIPEPTSDDAAYNERSLPPYLFALRAAGVSPVIIPLDERPEHVAELLSGVHGILLPGSGYDVDPLRYNDVRIPECGPADGGRSAMDELLLQNAFGLRKPILAVCYGTQALNVWLGGSLVQDLKVQLHTPVEHAPDRSVMEAHAVKVSSNSRLGALLGDTGEAEEFVNSSHHQAIRAAGKNLRVTAISPADGVVEAIELDSGDHFAVGVQWHPERTYNHSPFSRFIFTAFAQASMVWLQLRDKESLASLR